MTLRLESPPSTEAGVAGQHALVLLGFRNDLARHRVLRSLHELVEPVPAELPLPFTLVASVDLDTGTRLSAKLSDLGAIVRLTPCDDCPQPTPPAVMPTIAYDLATARSANSWIPNRTLRLMLIGTIGLFFAVRAVRVRPPDDGLVADAPQAKAHAANAPGGSTRAQVSEIRRLIADGDLAGAQRAVDRALEGQEDASVLALQGDIAAKRSNWGAARTAYERAVKAGSTDPQVFISLATIYRQQGMQKDAVEMLNRAKEHGAAGSDFEAMVGLVVTEQDAESNFDAQKSPHFIVSMDEGADAATARLILDDLEDAYLTVGHKVGVYPADRIPVALYAAQDFQRVTHSPDWAGALYDGRMKIPVGGVSADTAELAKTLRHEYAHALVRSITGSHCPVWLNEGVAMWAEEDRDGEREQWALGAMQFHRPFSLTQLEKSFGRLSPLEAAAAYGQSYLTVRHIIGRYGEIPLQKLLVALASADSTNAAFQDALGIELASLEDELQFAPSHAAR